MSYETFFSRNIGFITKAQQNKIKKLSIGIAGAGGDGGLLAERLARFGVGKLVLAEPDCFEPTNINRQFACNSKTFGMNKAQAIAKELKIINPDLKIEILNTGITEKNVKYFVDNSDIVVDEIEYSMPHISVMLAREARRQGKYVFMGANIGWGASIFCFTPKGMTFEKYFNYNEKSETIDPLRYIKKLPKYFNEKMLNRVLMGKISMPSVSSSVGLVASFVSSAVMNLIINNKVIEAPRFIWVDSIDLKLEKR